MVNLKLSKEESAEYETNSTLVAANPMYPYGLCIHLDTETINKLGLEKMPEPGQLMTITALVEVKSVSISETLDQEPTKSIDLQITDLELGEASKKEEKKEISAGSLYGNNSAGIKLPPGATILGSGYF